MEIRIEDFFASIPRDMQEMIRMRAAELIASLPQNVQKMIRMRATELIEASETLSHRELMNDHGLPGTTYSDRRLSDALASLGRQIVEINQANGWKVSTPESWDEEYKVPAVLALIHSEVSESLEAYRKNDKENFLEEMADTVIRVLDLTHGMEMNLATAIIKKLEVNKTRGYRHGGKRV